METPIESEESFFKRPKKEKLKTFENQLLSATFQTSFYNIKDDTKDDLENNYNTNTNNITAKKKNKYTKISLEKPNQSKKIFSTNQKGNNKKRKVINISKKVNAKNNQSQMTQIINMNNNDKLKKIVYIQNIWRKRKKVKMIQKYLRGFLSRKKTFMFLERQTKYVDGLFYTSIYVRKTEDKKLKMKFKKILRRYKALFKLKKILEKKNKRVLLPLYFRRFYDLSKNNSKRENILKKIIIKQRNKILKYYFLKIYLKALKILKLRNLVIKKQIFLRNILHLHFLFFKGNAQNMNEELLRVFNKLKLFIRKKIYKEFKNKLRNPSQVVIRNILFKNKEEKKPPRSRKQSENFWKNIEDENKKEKGKKTKNLSIPDLNAFFSSKENKSDQMNLNTVGNQNVKPSKGSIHKSQPKDMKSVNLGKIYSNQINQIEPKENKKEKPNIKGRRQVLTGINNNLLNEKNSNINNKVIPLSTVISPLKQEKKNPFGDCFKFLIENQNKPKKERKSTDLSERKNSLQPKIHEFLTKKLSDEITQITPTISPQSKNDSKIQIDQEQRKEGLIKINKIIENKLKIISELVIKSIKSFISTFKGNTDNYRGWNGNKKTNKNKNKENNPYIKSKIENIPYKKRIIKEEDKDNTRIQTVENKPYCKPKIKENSNKINESYYPCINQSNPLYDKKIIKKTNINKSTYFEKEYIKELLKEINRKIKEEEHLDISLNKIKNITLLKILKNYKRKEKFNNSSDNILPQNNSKGNSENDITLPLNNIYITKRIDKSKISKEETEADKNSFNKNDSFEAVNRSEIIPLENFMKIKNEMNLNTVNTTNIYHPKRYPRNVINISTHNNKTAFSKVIQHNKEKEL